MPSTAYFHNDPDLVKREMITDEAFVGEIRLFAGTYVPQGWMSCDGRELTIQSYEMLYSLVGTMYGGDGRQTFALPDLRGRVPVHMADNLPQGESGGREVVTLTPNELPRHRHKMGVSGLKASSSDPAGLLVAASQEELYATTVNEDAKFNDAAITTKGESRSHDNIMPYQAIQFIIAVMGPYPARH